MVVVVDVVVEKEMSLVRKEIYRPRGEGQTQVTEVEREKEVVEGKRGDLGRIERRQQVHYNSLRRLTNEE